MENARNVTIKLHHRIGRYVKVHLYFASRWIMLSEIAFVSGKFNVICLINYCLFNFWSRFVIFCFSLFLLLQFINSSCIQHKRNKNYSFWTTKKNNENAEWSLSLNKDWFSCITFNFCFMRDRARGFDHRDFINHRSKFVLFIWFFHDIQGFLFFLSRISLIDLMWILSRFACSLHEFSFFEMNVF